MGYSFSLWANVSPALCVSLHLAFISVSCSRSLFFFFPTSLLSARSIQTFVSSSPSRAVSLTIPSRVLFRPLVQSLFAGFLWTLHTAGESVCVWAAFRPPVGWAGSALLPGCCWRSTQAFRHSPSLAGRDSPSTPQAPPCPPTPAPPRLHRGRGRESLVYTSY